MGIGAGAASLYVPRYVAEVSPVAVRGALATLNQVAYFPLHPSISSPCALP